MAIKGIDVILYGKTQTGTDDFNRPIYEETAETVSNVLVAPASTEDITNELSMTGKRLEYLLGIPKGDEHDWEDKVVEFFGQKFRTFGMPTQGIEDMIPLSWNKKVKCERYE